MKKLTGREKRFLGVGIFAVLVYLMAQFVILPMSAARGSGEGKLMLAQAKLRRARELAAASGLQARVAVTRAQLEQEQKRLLQATDVNQAGAQLQAWLVRRATELQLEVLRSDFLPAGPVAPNYLRVPVRLELNGRITQLAAYLASITQGDQQLASLDELQFISNWTDKQKKVHCMVVISGLMPRAK